MASPLISVWPRLGERLDWVSLGEFPTRIERLETLERELGAVAPLYVKRDDRSSPAYGGNKVRTLEALFGVARARGSRQILATGAYGSNHAVATMVHAPRAGLEPGALLFAQPKSRTALENVRVSVARAAYFRALPHWSLLPAAMWRERRSGRAIMMPGGATPSGALGYVAAGLELARQVEDGQLPAPGALCVGVGSTCTAAGLLVGLAHAARLGIGFRTPPLVVAVRVTPWPVTSRWRILRLAQRTAERLTRLTEAAPRLAWSTLASGLVVDGRELGPGYGIPSESGSAATALFRQSGLFQLDSTYSAKAAAGFLRRARSRLTEPLLFWSTKSTAPLPTVEPFELAKAPARLSRWMREAERELEDAEARALSSG